MSTSVWPPSRNFCSYASGKDIENSKTEEEQSKSVQGYLSMLEKE